MKKTIYLLLIMVFLISCKNTSEKPLSLLERMDKAEEVFLIDSKKDTIIEGKEGTLIFIEKESFVDRYGNLHYTNQIKTT